MDQIAEEIAVMEAYEAEKIYWNEWEYAANLADVLNERGHLWIA